jgi:ATP-dependent helicase/nuclease subunit B
VVERWQQVTNASRARNLSSETSEALYGDELNLSASALEAFASCPFRFFVSHGLKAREREEFDVDVRQTGSFQHEVLAEFHRRVRASGRRWRELDPAQAVEWVREIGEAQLASYEHGLFLADAAREFQARALLQNLERVVTTLTLWSRQNEFEPAAVEVGFGLDENGWPGWRLDLGRGQSVQVRGRVDRVDLLPMKDGSTAVAIVDYKSSGKQFEDLKFENGLQLQLPAYLSAICENRDARASFGGLALRPAGVFYVGLRVKPGSGRWRTEAEEKGFAAVAGAFQHLGRFDASLVAEFDTSGARKGEQFRFSFNKDGSLSKRSNDALPAPAFAGLLVDAAQQIRELGSRILNGETEVSPYQQGQEVACGLCVFRPVCRFDSWAESYRPLRRRQSAGDSLEGTGGC